MLATLFKEAPEVLPPVDEMAWTRHQWRQSLDKGHVPTSIELEGQWLKEYPQRIFPAEITDWIEQVAHHAWLRELFYNPAVREIFAHGPGLVEALGADTTVAHFPLAPADWNLWVETLATQLRSEFNFNKPCSSTHWIHAESPWRVTLLHASLTASDHPKVFLRKLSAVPYSLDKFALDQTGEAILRGAIANRDNILVAGPTGSGKTSLLSSLIQSCDENEHLVLLEDTQELSCHSARLTRLLANPTLGHHLSELLAHTLRLSPDRIVLGEMRSHEVVPFLLAMNTGHKGVMATLHASSALDTLHRVAQLFTLASNRKEMDYREVLRLVCKNVGLVVFVEKRKVKQIIRVYGCEESQPLYDVVWDSAAQN